MLVTFSFAVVASTACSSAPSGGGNSNDNTVANSNDNTIENANDNTAANTNDNVSDNTNTNVNTNDNVVEDDLIPSACCLSDGSCTVATREQCEGAFVGGGTPCGATSCQVSPFTNEAADRGIVYRALFPRGEADVVPGSGVAFLDLDNDGDFDLVALGHVGDGLVGVYEADGQGHFTDRSADTGIAPSTWARAVVAADYDADGDMDLYLSHWSVPNRLMRNDGEFRFTDVTDTAGVGKIGHGAGCAWGDYDGDGWLDLYATDYLIDGPNSLFHNLADGTFEDVAAELGVIQDRRGMQAAFFDFDGDADQDLYVANDLQGGVCPTCCNEMYVNNDDGTFTKAGDETGANACLNSMCIAIGDVNNDQTQDMFFTDDSLPPGNILIANQGDGTFEDVSITAGVKASGVIGWGGMFFDYDNDGRLELFVTYNTAANQFFENDGAFPLRDIAPEVGLDSEGQSYCTAVSDVDNDGDLDFVLWNRQEDLYLYINHEGQKRRWVKFDVIGQGWNLRAVGATVAIRAGGLGQVRQVFGFNNFKGMDEARLHFGLDTARVVDEINVTWPGGNSRTLTNYAGNQVWTLYPPGRLGDADGDGVTGSSDHAVLEACRGAVRPGCEMMDFDGDADIDDADQAAQ
jgi:hypothetical protein